MFVFFFNGRFRSHNNHYSYSLHCIIFLILGKIVITLAKISVANLN